MWLTPAVTSAHAGVANLNSGTQFGRVKKAIPSCAFLNAINKYKHTEGAMDQHVDTKPENNLDAEEHNDTDVGQGNRQEDGKSDSDPTDDLEDEQVDESDDD